MGGARKIRRRPPSTSPLSAAGAGTYLYCLVRQAARPAVGRSRARLPGASPTEALPVGPSLWLIAAEVPLARYSEAQIERGLQDLDWVVACALAHETIVEQFMGAGAVVPMKLFTIFTSRERALRHIDRQRPRLLRVLRRVAGCVEWGVRVTLDAGPPAAGASAGRPVSGTAYLSARRAARDGARARSAGVEAAAHQVMVRLGRLARRVRPRQAREGASTPALVAEAAMLVPKRRTAALKAAARRAGRELRQAGCALELSGPWPPYHFLQD